ncbi:MAG: ABC transporter permease [Eubacteriales bacterium]|jgi:putative ABC transport system permease protein
MYLRQAFKMAFKSISGKKGRSFLTMLGIIIGSAAVIVLVSIVQGQQRAMMEQFEKMGTNTINIYDYSWGSTDISQDLYEYCLTLDPELMVGFTPNYNTWTQLRYKDKISDINVYMGSELYSLCSSFELSAGRDLSYMDIQKLNKVCVLGAKVQNDLFNYEDPIGKKILVNGEEFTVVGTYASKGMSYEYGGDYYDNFIVIPYTLTTRVIKSSYRMSNYIVKASSASATEELIKQIDQWMMAKVGQYNYHVYSENTYMEWQNESFMQTGLLLGGIAGISLIVGGIGIMNIMLVTVTERTREIGIRKAIGAPRRAIITQFLIEASALSAMGGILGILLGAGLTLIFGKLYLNAIFYPTALIVILAFFVSVAFGIGFGVYPAIRASKLLPVEALRNE